MVRFIILGAFFSIPIIMLGVMGVAIVAKVRAGRYAEARFLPRNSPYQPAPKAPRPLIAVLWVMMPVGWAGFYSVSHGELDWVGGSIFILAAIVLAAFVYVAAGKRCREFGDQ